MMAKNSNDWKKRLGMVYSTDPDFEYKKESQGQEDTPAPENQKLTIQLDKKKRKGKVVTLITGFVGKEEDLLELAKILKKKCGTGGSAKEGNIIIQGGQRDQIGELLKGMGYQIRHK